MKQGRVASQPASSRASNPTVSPPDHARHVGSPAPRGGLRCADLVSCAGSTAPWSTHTVAPRLRYFLACPVATPCALVLVLVTKNLPA